jgi:hypothetical protein
MKNSKFLIFNLIISGFILLSCAVPEGITPWTMSKVQKGSSIDEAFYVGFRNPIYSYEFTDIPGISKITVKVYYKAYVKKMYHYVALAFVEGNLLYWGYPDEFTKSEDPLINKIGDRLCTALFNDIND